MTSSSRPSTPSRTRAEGPVSSHEEAPDLLRHKDAAPVAKQKRRRKDRDAARLTPEEAEDLLKFSTRTEDCYAKRPWRQGYDAATAGLSPDVNPYPLTPMTDRHGLPRLTIGGDAKHRPATKPRLSWIEGFEEGAAVRAGRFFNLMRRRRATATKN